MEEIGKRLNDTTEQCIKAFDAWKDSGSDKQKQEDLREAVHDLRKVASRLEIEMAARERKNSSSNAIPIPSHKSNRKSKGGGESDHILPDHDDGNQQPKRAPSGGPRRGGRSRRPAQKAAE